MLCLENDNLMTVIIFKVSWSVSLAIHALIDLYRLTFLVEMQFLN